MNGMIDLFHNSRDIAIPSFGDEFELAAQHVPPLRVDANEPLVPRREQVTHHRHAIWRHFSPIDLLEVFVLRCKVLHSIELRKPSSSQSLLVAVETEPRARCVVGRYGITLPEKLDSWQAIAIKNASDLKTVCLWRRFFGRSFTLCRRFARLYRLRIRKPFSLAEFSTLSESLGLLFDRGKTTCGFLPTDPTFPSAERSSAGNPRDPSFRELSKSLREHGVSHRRVR